MRSPRPVSGRSPWRSAIEWSTGSWNPKHYREADAKRLYYLSMEFLISRSLTNNLTNLGLLDECRAVLGSTASLWTMSNRARSMPLGNGGLGRLAACFLDSLATLSMPGFGYGINYEFGLFRQEIRTANRSSSRTTGARTTRRG